jgi:hypothetical protein
MAALTEPQQEAAMAKMRTTFASNPGSDERFQLDDETFGRYLRARNYDVEKASSLLASTLKWRQEFGLKNMLGSSTGEGWAETMRKENASGKLYVRGFSLDGSAILYMRPKNENTRDHDGNLKHLVFNMEKCVAALHRAGKGETKITLLIDYDGYSISTAPPMKTARETLQILQNHYPERLRCAYCLRPPWIFQAFWTTISPFIDPKTKEKVVMVPQERMIQILHEKINPDVLEESCGGRDSRPFDSARYLSTPDFGLDYHALLQSAST